MQRPQKLLRALFNEDGGNLMSISDLAVELQKKHSSHVPKEGACHVLTIRPQGGDEMEEIV